MNLKLANLRLSYPNLFEPKAGPEGGEPKYNASFLLDKSVNAAQITALKNGILEAAKAQWGAENVKWNGHQLVIKKPGGGGAVLKHCLRDGTEKPETTGYGEGVMFFAASNKMQPAVVDKNPSHALTKNDGCPYAGSMVNVSIRLWAQDNQFGKRVNAQLQAVQFSGDGEAFGDGSNTPVNPVEIFENLEGHAPSDNDGHNAGPEGPDIDF